MFFKCIINLVLYWNMICKSCALSYLAKPDNFLPHQNPKPTEQPMAGLPLKMVHNTTFTTQLPFSSQQQSYQTSFRQPTVETSPMLYENTRPAPNNFARTAFAPRPARVSSSGLPASSGIAGVGSPGLSAGLVGVGSPGLASSGLSGVGSPGLAAALATVTVKEEASAFQPVAGDNNNVMEEPSTEQDLLMQALLISHNQQSPYLPAVKEENDPLYFGFGLRPTVVDENNYMTDNSFFTGFFNNSEIDLLDIAESNNNMDSHLPAIINDLTTSNSELNSSLNFDVNDDELSVILASISKPQ